MWGVGRHGPGSNVFSYFVEPNGFVTEYTTEVDQVDDNYVGHDAKWWKEQNLFPCRWNMAGAPSAVRPQGDGRRAGRGREPALRAGDGEGARPLTGSRRMRAAVAALCLASAAATAPAQAQNYPSRTVEIVVPFAAGGGTDLLARLIGEGLSKRLGQSFVPLNRPGANTNNGTLQVVKGAADGHTLLIAASGLPPIRRSTSDLPFDPLQRSRADHADRQFADHPGGADRVAGEHAGRVCGLSEGASGRAQLRLLWRRLESASCGRAVPVHDRHHDRARALCRRRSGLGRRHGQQRADAVRQRAAGAGPDPRRPAQGRSRSPPTGARRCCRTCRPSRESGLDYRTGTWFGLLAPAKTPDGIIATLHKQTVDTLQEPAVRGAHRRAGRRRGRQHAGRIPRLHQERDGPLAAVIRNANIQLD